MDIHEKINFRDNAIFWLTWGQYEQLIKINRMVLAPYYNDLLIKQDKMVADTECFKNEHAGKNRWEYENGINIK